MDYIAEKHSDLVPLYDEIYNKHNRSYFKTLEEKAEEMAKKQGVTEELKATDMMRWIGLINNIRACADEIVLNDIVYS